MGSPPPAWGKLDRGNVHPPVTRFTPTRVGKAFGVESNPGFPEVHPHPRGESA